DQAKPVAVGRGRAEAAPVVLDDGRDTVWLTRERDADVLRARVLDDVRQRLLDDPVERGLDLGRQPLLAQGVLEVDGHAAVLGEALRETLERRDEPEVVERLRPQL